MTKVKFIDVGRDKRNWIAEMNRVTPDMLAREAKINGGIRSNHTAIVLDVDSMTGEVYVAGRNVGQFEILKT